MSERNEPSLASLRDELVTAHRERFGSNADSDLYLGLQLTHSGRFSRPNVWNRPEPLAAHANPVLDKRFPGGVALMTDEAINRLIGELHRCRAHRAYAIGFEFVDIKHCHGYFGHELLSARHRTGRYGGSLANRTRVSAGHRRRHPRPRAGPRASACLQALGRRFACRIARVAERRLAPPALAGTGTARLGVLQNESSIDAPSRTLDGSSGRRVASALMQDRADPLVCITAGSPCPTARTSSGRRLSPAGDGYSRPRTRCAASRGTSRVTAKLKAEFQT